jgi:DNA-binding transcriptional ArsR family regulator
MKARRSRPSTISGLWYRLNEAGLWPKQREGKLRLYARATNMRVEVASFGGGKASDEEQRRGRDECK